MTEIVLESAQTRAPFGGTRLGVKGKVLQRKTFVRPGHAMVR